MKETKSRAVAGSKADAKLGVQKGKNAAKGVKLKRPPSAFFVFMEKFRAEYKASHPNNKSVATVGKAAGAKWKSMSEEEKAPFVEKAAKLKAEHEKVKARQEEEAADAASDKSKSEVEEEGENEDEGDD
ncbi:high mobility group B protein 2-like [Carex rostrata]